MVSTTLSPKQAETLAYIESEITRQGRPPTYRDIARALGYDAVGTVQDHISALIRKGFLHKEPGVARGIRLTRRTESIDIPILGAIPAGPPMEAIENALGYLSIPAQWKGEIYALRVTGESMINAGIFDGDFVIIHRQAAVHSGDIVVAMIDGECTVKYLERKSGQARLLPANPRFKPIEIPPESDNLIQGKVVSVQRYY
ncbi:transcriptional repressor LexA [Bdellovibrionota bacterium FG-1]